MTIYGSMIIQIDSTFFKICSVLIMLDSIQNSNTFFCPKSIDIEQCKKQWIYLSGTKYKLLDVFLSIVKLTGLKRKKKNIGENYVIICKCFCLHKNLKTSLSHNAYLLNTLHLSTSFSSLMANEELTESEQQEDPSQQSPNADEENGSNSDSDSDSDSSSQSSGDDFYISESENEAEGDNAIFNYVRPSDIPPDPNANPETNIRRFNRVLDGKRVKRMQEEEEEKYTFYEDLFDFPRDPERWKEQDLREIWADGPLEMTKPGWDPVWADEDDWEIVNDEIQEGRDPGIQPFYVPYRKPYPAIPDNHYDIENAKGVVEELDRIEEFLQWVSYIFPDGSS